MARFGEPNTFRVQHVDLPALGNGRQTSAAGASAYATTQQAMSSHIGKVWTAIACLAVLKVFFLAPKQGFVIDSTHDMHEL
jgi:hypothetical protein